jgi:COP9 signalosome complex subunit 5
MTAQIGDLVEKLGKTEQSVQHRCGIGAMSPVIAAARAAKNKSGGGDKKDDKEAKNEETPLAKAVRDRFVFLLVSCALYSY